MNSNKWRSLPGCAIFKSEGWVGVRKLFWFTVGFACGCGLCVSFLWRHPLQPLLIYALASSVLCLALARKNDLLRIPAALLLGLSLSVGWFSLFWGRYIRSAQPMDGQIVHLQVIATDYSEKTDYGFSLDGIAKLEGNYYRLRLFQKDDTRMEPGDILESDVLLRMTTPGGRKESAYYQGSGVFLTATQKGETALSHVEKGDFLFLPARIGLEAKNRIARFFPADTAPFAKALLLGDTSDLSYSQDTALKLSGIRHVTAVSGLHISILFALVFLFFRPHRWLVLLVSTPLLLFFAAMTGFSPSVTRACLMYFLIALGQAVFEEYDTLTSLAFACLVMLLLNPFVLLSVSFQLSVASVLGILLFASPASHWLLERILKGRKKGIRGGLARWFAGSVSVSVSALIFSAPLSAYYFGTVSLIGIVTNLLTIWVIGFLFYGIGAVSILGGAFPSACQWLGRLLSWPIRYVLFISRLLSQIPFAAVYTESKFILYWLILCYVLLALFLILGRKRGRYFFTVGAVCLAAAVAASVLLPRMDKVRLNVLDVGEGQSILIQSGGEHYLIDCGGDSEERTADRVAQTLLSQGVFHLDGVVLTHYDRDHVGGLENLLTRIPIEHFYLPDQGEIPISPEDGALCTLVSRDTEIPVGHGKLVLLEPGGENSNNENCMCVLFESEECVILITGDRGRSGERHLLASYTLPDVDVLIAGHHGSKNSTTEELLRAVRPETVIISVGKNNRYGHPAQELLDRLAEYNCTVYRTDEMGSVLVRR